MSHEKRGTIFWYDFMVGAQIVPQKFLCDRIEKDGWENPSEVVSISREETQPTHNNKKIRQASGGTTRRIARIDCPNAI
jgi:hypothetical protein